MGSGRIRRRRELGPRFPRLGAHMSTAGGLPRAIERALEVQAGALQIFVKSSRRWAAPPLDEAEAMQFRRRLQRAGLRRFTLAHASYLINLAAADSTIRERSIAALREELERCASLQVPHLVLHPGSHMGAGEPTGLARIVEGLERVLESAGSGTGAAPEGDSPVDLLLENTAGQGTGLGWRFEQLAEILQRSPHRERLGVCFDTNHAFAAGYDLRSRATYDETFRQLDRTVGLRRIRAFHLNDSAHPLGSRRDRHEHIGQGRLGRNAFRLLLNDARFRGRPMVLETPKGPDLAEDRINLEVLRSLVRPASR